MRPIELLRLNPRLFVRTATSYYVRRAFPALTGWSRPLAEVEQAVIGGSPFEIDTGTMGVSNGIRQMLAGCYELHLQDILRSFLGPGDIFIDVGANAGFISVFAASLVGNGKVYSFEAGSKYFRQLQRNASLNPAIIPRQAAVSSGKGIAKFFVTQSMFSGGSSLNSGFVPPEKLETVEEVETISLGEFILEQDIKPRVIKIDVEGHELSVIQGLVPALHKVRPILICEVAANAVAVNEMLRPFGYSMRDAFAPSRSDPTWFIQDAIFFPE